MKIFPSLISSNLLNLEATLEQLNSVADGYHLDVMDFHFVPNLTWGPQFINAIIAKTNLPVHVHVMIENPSRWFEKFKLRADDTYIFHREGVDSDTAVELIELARKRNTKIGIALNPQTEVDVIAHLLPQVDLVLVMSVNPGFSGQKFIPSVMPKISQLNDERIKQKLKFAIALDGGVTQEMTTELISRGVDQIAAASAIFSSIDPVKAIRDFHVTQ